MLTPARWTDSADYYQEPRPVVASATANYSPNYLDLSFSAAGGGLLRANAGKKGPLRAYFEDAKELVHELDTTGRTVAHTGGRFIDAAGRESYVLIPFRNLDPVENFHLGASWRAWFYFAQNGSAPYNLKLSAHMFWGWVAAAEAALPLVRLHGPSPDAADLANIDEDSFLEYSELMENELFRVKLTLWAELRKSVGDLLFEAFREAGVIVGYGGTNAAGNPAAVNTALPPGFIVNAAGQVVIDPAQGVAAAAVAGAGAPPLF